MPSTAGPPPRKRPWGRFSILGLLAATAACAFASAALFTASDMWARLTFTVAMLCLLLAVLRAIFRSGAQRAFAVGFAVCCGVFLAAATWKVSDTTGFPISRQPLADQLITTKLSELAYQKVLLKVRTPPSYAGFGGGFGGVGGFYGSVYTPPGAGGSPATTVSQTTRGDALDGEAAAVDVAESGSAADEEAANGEPPADTSATASDIAYDEIEDEPAAATAAATGTVGGLGGGGFGGGGFGGPFPGAAAFPFYPSQDDFVRVGHALWALLFGFLGGLVASWLQATRPRTTDNTESSP